MAWNAGYLVRLFAVPTLLCVVALTHMQQSLQSGRSTWGSGCAFGMFCTVDFHGSRFYQLHLVDADGNRLPAAFPTGCHDLDLKTRVLPLQENLDQLAVLLLHRDWTSAEDSTVRLASSTDQRRISPVGVELQMWGIEFDQQDKSIARFPIIRTQQYRELSEL